ncbi:MAG: hypothetical protein B5M51_00655 [Anaerolinea sp. 4484_236]|nr:MAG: hypothetical protein B5M51_00655 [Anaerolinea sp. 4484_236]
MPIKEKQDTMGSPALKKRSGRSSGLRRTLLVTLLLMTLIPLIGISIITIWRQYANSRVQIINQLTSVATLKEAQIHSWFDSLSPDLELVVANPRVRANITELIGSQHNEILAAAWRGVILDTLKVALVNEDKFDEIFLIDETGKVIISTNPERDAQDFSDKPFFQEGLRGDFVQAPIFSPLYDEMVVFAAVPLSDGDDQAHGVLAGVAKLETINEIMLERAGLGETGETYLVNADHIILTEPRESPKWKTPVTHTHGADEALRGKNGASLYLNYQDPPNSVVGVYRWLPNLEVALLAEQSQAEAFASTFQNIWGILGATIITIMITIVVVIFVTDYIVAPLIDLTNIAVRATDGDLSQTISIERDDEIGILANAFNTMMAQLNKLIENLEVRVAERTVDLLRANTRLTYEAVEREHAEEDLRKIQQRLIETQEIASLGSWGLNVHTRKLQWSEETFKITGLKIQDAAPSYQDYVTLLHPDDGPLFEAHLEKAVKESLIYEIELRHRQSDGSYNHTLMRARPILLDNKVVKIRGSLLDITKRKQVEKALLQANLELERLTILDDLTQIANRRRFYAYLHQEWKKLTRTRTKLALILCDIDHFKQFNDTYGHLTGDECLYQVAQAINRVIRRPADLAARYGGEEFVILLPDTNKEGAEKIIKAVQTEIKDLAFFKKQPDHFDPVTLSFGISCTVPSTKFTPENLLGAADEALYEAKRRGRNTLATIPLNKPDTP